MKYVACSNFPRPLLVQNPIRINLVLYCQATTEYPTPPDLAHRVKQGLCFDILVLETGSSALSIQFI